MIKRKQIAFNLLDPKQKEMFDFIERMTNFSAYGKMLIYGDMRGQVQVVDVPIVDDKAYLKNLI